MKSLSRVQLLATQWTVAYQASLSMGFSRQEYWSGLPFPSPASQDKINTISFQSKAGIIWSLRYVHRSICRNIQRSLMSSILNFQSASHICYFRSNVFHCIFTKQQRVLEHLQKKKD